MMSYCARLEMNRLRIAINSIALNHPSRGLSGSTSTSTFFCRFKSTSKTPKPSQHHDSTQQVADLNQTVVELSTLFSRVLAAFGILHVVTEYGCKFKVSSMHIVHTIHKETLGSNILLGLSSSLFTRHTS